MIGAPVDNFYPRSPCGERPYVFAAGNKAGAISIHALLAESDKILPAYCIHLLYFYPRSPCGERPKSFRGRRCSANFYPRSPCGERRHGVRIAEIDLAFLSTLSLRRATILEEQIEQESTPISIHALLAESDRRHRGNDRRPVHFYPRSPCGERLLWVLRKVPILDFYPRSPCGERQRT